MDYKKMQVQAKDVKPGDRIWGKINDNITLAECKVYMVNQTIDNVTITSVHGKTYRVQPDLYFIRESTGYEADIKRLNQEIQDCAFSILDRIEMHILTLQELRDGKIVGQKLDPARLDTMADDFKQAAETAISLAEHAGNQEALTDELKSIDQAADDGPYGRNK